MLQPPSLELDALRARLAAFETLQAVSRELTAELDLNTLLEKILSGAMDVSDSTAGSLLLYEAGTHELVFKVVVGGGGEVLKNTRLYADRGIAGESFAQQRVVIVDNAESDPRYFPTPASSVGMQVRQLMAVPLVRQGQALGVLEVMNSASGIAYTHDDAQLLLAFAAQSAIAIENAKLYGQVLEERDRILAVEAAVRHELARDLHDGPTQLLSVLLMQIRSLRGLSAREYERPPNDLVQLEATAQKALYQTRNILFDLRPVILEQRGLGPALEQYVTRLRMVEPFHVTLEAASLQHRREPKVEAAIFSIVQEAVNNSKRHSGAKNVWIEAVEDESGLRISVLDDGHGFDVTTLEENYGQRGSLGLLNMRERTEIAEGKLEIKSHANEGTRVILVVPRRDGTP